MGIGLLVLLLGFQLVNNNWGYAKGLRSHPGIDMRTLASIIKTSSLPSHLVVIGGGFGCGSPRICHLRARAGNHDHGFGRREQPWRSADQHSELR